MNEFLLIMPEIVLALTLGFIILSEVTYFGEQTRLILWIALVGLGAAFVETLILYGNTAASIFGGALSIDAFSIFFKMYLIGLGSFSIITVSQSKEIFSGRLSEYCALIVAATLAMCLMASVTDLALAFLCCLLLSTITHFLTAYGRRSPLSTEAAVKSLAFGAVSQFLLLNVSALLFASTHSLNIQEIHKALLVSPLSSQLLAVVVIFGILAFTYYLGAFPFYFLMPDVLQGAPTPVSAFLSIGPRAAGFALITRFCIGIFAQSNVGGDEWQVIGECNWTQILTILAMASMFIGALLAFRQNSAKRLVGYLVISDTGFLLIGLLVLDRGGLAALLFNLVVGLLSLLGIFYVIAYLVGELQSDHLDQLRGVLKGAVPESICLIIFLLCFVGIPPSPGFIGKFALIGAAVRHERYFLASAAAFSMVLGTAAVTRFAYHLMGNFCQAGSFGGLSLEGVRTRKVMMGLLLIPIVLVGVFADLLFGLASRSLDIFW